MRHGTGTLDRDVTAESEQRFPVHAGPGLVPVLDSDSSIVRESEPLYRKLVSNFGSVQELKTKLVDGDTRSLSFGWSTDLHEHFEILRKNFIGLPLLCFAHAQLIVCIRRKIDLEENISAFQKLWATEAEFLAERLNSRWLISACDTFVDHGSDAQKSLALVLVMLINTIKLAETERLMLADTTPDASKIDVVSEKRRARVQIELWDGITAFAVASGDMPRNMLRRLAILAEKDVALRIIARTLIQRAVAADTLFGRLARLNEGFLPAEYQR